MLVREAAGTPRPIIPQDERKLETSGQKEGPPSEDVRLGHTNNSRGLFQAN